MRVVPIKGCRLCGGGNLDVIFNLGEQALAGHFPAPDEPDAPRAPLELALCSDCGLVQLAHNCEADALFDHSYGYRSGINATLTAHLQGIARRVEELSRLGPGDTVLDIGSNDATLLRSYSVAGLVRIGIDRLRTGLGHQLTHWLLGLPWDATNSLRLLRLEHIPAGTFERVRHRGYSFFWECLYVLKANGHSIAELPVDLPVRQRGSSKLRLGDVLGGFAYLLQVAIRRLLAPRSFLRAG